LSTEAAEGMHNSLEVENLGSNTFEMSGVDRCHLVGIIKKNLLYVQAVTASM